MDSAKEQQAAISARSSNLRYPLRSAGKGKDGKPAEVHASGSSASTRGRVSSIVSKSVSVLDISGKDKSSAKPPRRLSIPSKSAATSPHPARLGSITPIPSKSAATSPHPARLGSITPISEHRVKKPDAQRNMGTPASDMSKSVNKKKFSVLSSVSYWLSQIKLSESASKHSISLGFFKLAMESGCEPLQRAREELKLYAVRYNILELGEPAIELLRSYGILEEVEDAQNSRDCSQAHEEGTKSSDDASSCSPSARSGSLKPKPVNAPGAAESTKKGSNQRKFPANRASYNRNPANSGSLKDGNGNAQKKTRKPRNLDSNQDQGQAKTITKKAASETVASPPAEESQETTLENKENMDHHQLVDESISAVELQSS